MRLILPTVFLVSAALSAQPASKPAFTVERLADGVYAAVPTRPPGLLVQSNHLFIVNDRDVVVVDADFSPALTREAIAALRTVTNKPVSAVINTHWHDDHILGDQVYRDTFGKVDLIAQREALTYLPTTGLTNRQNMLRDGAAFVEQLKKSVAAKTNLFGKPATDVELASMEADVAQWEPYARDVPTLTVPMPNVVVDDALTLTRGDRTIEIRHLGRGHTAGDLVVWLPKEKIVATGDLVIAPVPLIGGDQSYVGDWIDTLDRVFALGAAIMLPGHGPVMRDDKYAREEQALLKSLKTQADDAIARGDTREQAIKAVHVDDFRKSMAGDDPVLNLQFSTYVAGPAVTAIYREAKK